MKKEIRVKCSLCFGESKGCIRCLDGTQELRAWHHSRGLSIPEVKYLPSGYFRISFNSEIWAQFPRGYVGILKDEYIFNPVWNRGKFNNFYIMKS